MIKWFTGFGIALLLLTGCAKNSDWHLPENSAQLLVVVSDSPDSYTAELRQYERDSANGGNWRQMAPAIPVTLGSRGLGWGSGIHPATDSALPQKKEGDRKSPAGVFRLSSVFGFSPADSLTAQLRMPYVHISTVLECIDDSKSKYYNQLVANDTVAAVDWQSSEKMRNVGEEYHLGVFVDHNVHPATPGDGSCIFLHIWGGADDPTMGCTAMSAADMQRLARWLDARKHPLLVQFTRERYQEYLTKWGLPALD